MGIQTGPIFFNQLFSIIIRFAVVQAGCTVKTECQVRYVVRNPYDIGKEERISRKRRRRWLVFFNETDYITSDFVIISGWVKLQSCHKFGLKKNDINNPFFFPFFSWCLWYS